MTSVGAEIVGIVLAGGCLVAVCAGCSRTRAETGATPSAAPSPSARHPVEIREPPQPRAIVTDVSDAHGRQVRLECAACHGVRPADATTAVSADLEEFHQGLVMEHGRLTCGSCHQAGDGYTTLKLADGRSLPVEESMTLCGQCHGTQYRDYRRGSHGGMTGYWDLARGGRLRNHCLHCHDAHAPQYPSFMPVAGPRDRFPPAEKGGSHE